MTTRAATHGAGRAALNSALTAHKPFSTSGALKATEVNGATRWDSGRLYGVDLDKFGEDLTQIVYIVWSYATPIAWVTRDGEVYRVKGRFSPTTSKHQGTLYLLGG